MKKSLFLFSTLQIGGSEKRLVNIANALSDQDIPVEIAYLNPPNTLCNRINSKIPTTCLNRRGKFSLTSTYRLNGLLSYGDASTVLCVNLYPVLYACAVKALRIRNRPKIIVSINTTDFHTQKERFAMRIYAPLLNSVDRIIFGSYKQQTIWQQRYHLNHEKCSVIYNGVDLQFFNRSIIERESVELRNTLCIDAQHIVVGTVGQLRPEKQQKDLIEAIVKLRSEFSDLLVTLTGDGPERGILQNFVNKAKMPENVRFLGEVGDVRHALEILDIFVISSTTETFSNAALEAMAMSLPTILSDVGGAQEMIPKHRHDDLLYPVGDVDILAQKIRNLLVNPSLRQKIGKELREHVATHFDSRKMIEMYRLQFIT